MEGFEQIASIYEQPSIEAAKVKNLLQELRDSPSFDHT